MPSSSDAGDLVSLLVTSRSALSSFCLGLLILCSSLSSQLWFVDPNCVDDFLVLDSIAFPEANSFVSSAALGKRLSSPSSSTDLLPAKRHCVAGAGVLSPPRGKENTEFHDPCVEAVDEHGKPDLSTWKGMLTQTKAAQSKTAQTLLKKSRELRNLVMDDPPTKSGLIYSYARGKRGYMAPDGVVLSNGDVLEETAPVVEEVNVWKRVYTLEVLVVDEYRHCVLESGEYELGMTLDMTASSPANSSSVSASLPSTSNGVASEGLSSLSSSAASSEVSFSTIACSRGEPTPAINGGTWETLNCLENVRWLFL